ncbi:MAG: hypothetical protein IJK97_13050 [Thermoguttaceae bacterium]|nr:hypothetical protein [Thermoguttaceae bacterium]
MKKSLPILTFILLLAAAVAQAEVPESLQKNLLPEEMTSGERTFAPKEMVFEWLLPQIEAAEAKRRADYEAMKTPEQIAEYQARMKKNFIDAIGGFPERTPLNAKITGRIQDPEFTIEKILFESQPGLYVTANLYLPNEAKYPKPWNGVVVVCGHSHNGKGYENYQRVTALHALNGIAAMIVDPIDQGERFQNIDPVAKKELSASVHGHNLLGIGSILLGRNTAMFEIWDAMRAFDYMQTRDDIRHENLGLAGLSGGGTQTSYVMALEDRVDVACTCCYTCSLFGLMKMNETQDAEQNIFGQAAFGMDHADYCMMRAPKPTFFGTATKDFFPIEMGWQSFRDSKRLFSRMGYGNQVDLTETDNQHGYDKTLREATVRFMLRFLDHREAPIFEPESLQAHTDEEIQVTPEGFTMLLDGARSTFDLNRDYAKQLAAARKPIDAETVAKIRELAQVRDAEAFGEMKVQTLGEEKLDGVTVKKLVLEPEPGISLPALLVQAADAPEKTDVVLSVSDSGKTSGWDENILPLVKAGKSVLTVDLRGYGETQSFEKKNRQYYRNEFLGSDGKEFYIAYNLGKTFVGYRTEDLLAVTRWLKAQSFCAGVELYGLSEACIPVLHAAVLEKAAGTYSHVTLENCLVSWTNTVENGGHSNTPLVSTVHGALKVYDLPEMRDYLGDSLTVKSLKDTNLNK